MTSAEFFAEQARLAWEQGEAALAGGALAEARRWLERAARFAPTDDTIGFTLATTLLRAGDPAAAERFGAIASRHDRREAWLGLAAAHRAAGRQHEAVAALAEALSRHAPDPACAALLDSLVREARLPGWCGVAGDGLLLLGALAPDARLRLRLDDAALRVRDGHAEELKLPPRWRQAARLEVSANGAALLGSPVALAAIRRVEGFVAAHEGGIEGWAWQPNDPDTEPVITIRDALGDIVRTVRAQDANVTIADAPLARPRSFCLAAADLAGCEGPLHVQGPDGRELLGSPLDPAAEAWAAAAVARAAAAARGGRRPAEAAAVAEAAPAWADLRAPAPAVGTGTPPADVVIAVHDGGAAVLACLASVLPSLPAGSRAIVVDDASTDPGLTGHLRDLAAAGRIRLLRRGQQGGFPAAANAGLRAARNRDVVLLNSDTLVAPGWLEGLRAAAYAAPDIGSATPFSNDATILSFPVLRASANPVPDQETVRRLARLAAAANGAGVVEIPTGVGFCLYLRRDCLAEVGFLREDSFAQGYGEENDFCLRARHLGWRHVAATGVYVGHVGAASFGAAFGGPRRALLARNLRVLNRLHPGYDALIAAHVAADPLAPARRRIAALRWRQEELGTAGSVVLVSHDQGGGVARRVAERCAAIRAGGKRPIVLRPAVDAAGARIAGGVAVSDGAASDHAAPDYHDLVYRLPDEVEELAALLGPDRPHAVELHHLLGHHPTVAGLAARLGVPLDVHVHDYHWFCPRIALVGRERRYCGEPELSVCAECVADAGSNLEEAIAVGDLVARSAALLGGARRVVAPSADCAARLRRHFPGLRPTVEPWEDDAALPEPAAAPAPSPQRTRLVCVLGGIGIEKGYEVLLACARDAAARLLPLSFVVVGHTIDDSRLHATGRAFVTGEYAEAEAEALVRAQGADLAFLPSLWPETWSYTLSLAWRAGLPAAVFDLGTPAERVRATGRGWVLPLGLPTASINNALLAAGRLAEHGAVSHHSGSGPRLRALPL